MKETILAIMLAVFGENPPPLSIGLADLEYGVNGRTDCTIRLESGPQCQVVLDRDRMRDRRPASSDNPWMTGAEATIYHEFCHARVYFEVAEASAHVVDAQWQVHDEEAFGYRGHGREWRRCMREHRAWVNPFARHRT